MLVNLYSCADDVRKYRKQLTLIAENINAKPTQPCSVLQPTLILNNINTYIGANYIYIPEWSRYYFAVPTVLTGAEIQLQCDVDVLMSYDIGECDATVIRSEQAGINFLVDEQLPIDQSRFFIQGIKFAQTPIGYTAQDPKKYLLIINN